MGGAHGKSESALHTGLHLAHYSPLPQEGIFAVVRS